MYLAARLFRWHLKRMDQERMTAVPAGLLAGANGQAHGTPYRAYT
jgi:hypothetical protein